MNIAIIGSGPSSFYAAQMLSNMDNTRVDIIEKLFAPYGLVRYGVAPDHQKTKNIIKLFNRILEKENVNFFGNIHVSNDITLDFLSDIYDAVIIATGASLDKTLNIQGEELLGVYGSGEFVGWYNDNPEFDYLNPNLSCNTAVIIGNGNVALDCARILSKTETELHGSDISRKTLNLLSKSNIKKIYVIGRRGPKEAKFTISELREFKELKKFSAKLNYSREEIINFINDTDLDTRVKKNLEVFSEFYDTHQKDNQIIFDFFKTPLEILGDEKVEGIKVIDASKKEKVIETNFIIKAIGYKSSKINNFKMDANENFLFNKQGFITKNIYTTGWASCNSTGVIGTNKSRAIDTVNNLIKNTKSNKTNSTYNLKKKITENNIRYITKDHWKVIDKIEEENAMKYFAREKFRDINSVLEILDTN